MNLNIFSSFSVKTALRDARKQWKSLFVYTASVIAGVAALVAILSFRSDVLLTIDDQAKELLGADLEISSTSPYAEPLIQFIDSLGGEQATGLEFSSMVLFQSTGDTRLSQIRAISGEYPFYGLMETHPASAAYRYQNETGALVEQSIMGQLGVQIGDSIRIGTITLPITGELIKVPGEAAAFSLIGPRVYVPESIIAESGLLQRGSRVTYKTWFAFTPERNMRAITSELRPVTRENQARFETVESRKRDFDRIVDNLTKFLGLIAFIALLLGGLGVASAVYVYVKRKTSMVATLRCVGVSSKQILGIFFLQISLIGITGAVLGSVFGVIIQKFLPLLFTEFLPFEIVQQFSIPAILTGLGTGLAISIAFALLPLMSLTGISPLLTLRNLDYSPYKNLNKRTKIISSLVAFFISVSTIGFLLESWKFGLYFTLGLLSCLIILLVIARGLMTLIRLVRLKALPYVWRQGTANLFRPNNQTAVLITTLGMGMLLIGTLYVSQDMLLNTIEFETGDQQPDLVFFDIQSDQNDGIRELALEADATILENVPIVSMRLAEWKGRTVQALLADSTREVRRWALTRDYRVTYRSELNDAETILEGEWIGESDGIDSVVPISVATQIQDDLNLIIGDTLVFDVQGIPVTTVVASIREVDFQRPQPNFFVLFPSGVLEPAPQFFAMVLRTSGEENSTTALQESVVRAYPNVSALDVGLVLESVQTFLDKISMAVQFMALFSIITGLIVLASSIAISRFQRIKESVLLRTIGAKSGQITMIQIVEYVLLGIAACTTGLLLSVGSGWLLARFFFDLNFVPDIGALAIASLIIILLTLAAGLIGMQSMSKKSPLEILRAEAG